MAGEETRQRIDKWLWFARFFKTRGRAGEVAGSGGLRINGRHCTKPATLVGPGDELSFPQAGRVRAVRIEAVGVRRGPAVEAQTLFTDLAPEPVEETTDDAAPAPDKRPKARSVNQG
jgi:ribosome-associated heat shock protein Hsp15